MTNMPMRVAVREGGNSGLLAFWDRCSTVLELDMIPDY